jgi:hypothetical protein
MWIEDEAWKEYKIKAKEQELTEEKIRKLKSDLQDCMDREQRRRFVISAE